MRWVVLSTLASLAAFILWPYLVRLCRWAFNWNEKVHEQPHASQEAEDESSEKVH